MCVNGSKHLPCRFRATGSAGFPLSTKKENTLGIYPLGNSHNYRDYFADSSRSYDVTGVNFLIHGNNNKDETERLAWAFFDALEANRSAFMMNHKQVYFIRLLFDAPMDVGSDGNREEYTNTPCRLKFFPKGYDKK